MPNGDFFVFLKVTGKMSCNSLSMQTTCQHSMEDSVLMKMVTPNAHPGYGILSDFRVLVKEIQ